MWPATESTYVDPVRDLKFKGISFKLHAVEQGSLGISVGGDIDVSMVFGRATVLMMTTSLKQHSGDSVTWVVLEVGFYGATVVAEDEQRHDDSW